MNHDNGGTAPNSFHDIGMKLVFMNQNFQATAALSHLWLRLFLHIKRSQIKAKHFCKTSFKKIQFIAYKTRTSLLRNSYLWNLKLFRMYEFFQYASEQGIPAESFYLVALYFQRNLHALQKTF